MDHILSNLRIDTSGDFEEQDGRFILNIEDEVIETTHHENLNKSLPNEKNLKPLLYIPSNKLGTPTNAENNGPKTRGETTTTPSASAAPKPIARKLSLTDEMNPYVYSPSNVLKRRMKAESPLFS